MDSLLKNRKVIAIVIVIAIAIIIALVIWNTQKNTLSMSSTVGILTKTPLKYIGMGPYVQQPYVQQPYIQKPLTTEEQAWILAEQAGLQTTQTPFQGKVTDIRASVLANYYSTTPH